MPRTVLIVDDNPPYRGMLKSMLSMRGFQTVVSASAADALRLGDEVVYDAVLSDYDMPGVNGLEFCRLLKERNRAKGRDIPVWIMTGALDPEVSKRASDMGAQLVMRKPFNIDEMCSKIEREIEKREAAGATGRPSDQPEAGERSD